MASVRAVIATLTGEETEFSVEATCTVHELRREIAAEWDIIPECLKLVHGADILDSKEELVIHADDTASISLLALVSLDAVHERIQSGDSRMRLISLRALAKLTPKSSEAAMDAIGTRLKDSIPEVRQTAVQMMAQVADKGDQRVIGQIIECTKDRDVIVRRAALAALPEVSLVGDRLAIDAACCALDDEDQQAKALGTELLFEMAGRQRGNDLVITAVCKYLEECIAGMEQLDRRHFVHRAHTQRAVVEALARLAEKGNQHVFSVLSPVCIDTRFQEFVSGPALEVLPSIVERGDESAVVLCLQCLRENLLQATLALAKVALPGDKRAVGAALHLLELGGEKERLGAPKCRLADGNLSILRRTGAECLELCAIEGDTDVLAALCSSLEDKDSSVRDSAVKSLIALTPCGHDLTVSGCIAHSAHAKADVRRSAIQALTQVARQDEESVIDVLSSRLEDNNLAVRIAALDGLVHISSRDRMKRVSLMC
eukprot:TRINITY_DN9115_c0_g1_i1.p1 TRINITY_DN9115_c0_g1~~TRINITY_DN9115_c0_g1_i1.p1  ORF type:complete len:487 (+),score=109.51 TRINITY_DN9115_c0_g1_i1:180-1640(+)